MSTVQVHYMVKGVRLTFPCQSPLFPLTSLFRAPGAGVAADDVPETDTGIRIRESQVGQRMYTEQFLP